MMQNALWKTAVLVYISISKLRHWVEVVVVKKILDCIRLGIKVDLPCPGHKKLLYCSTFLQTTNYQNLECFSTQAKKYHFIYDYSLFYSRS